ncbi:hypothetical protein GKZ90_0000815 [Flavobacterium sp. MC2016-06]|uniref:hypothetical protein n=1 Tax=Flavobacterium sp. MC2016-06 TaxID=2676308 RepID=UPI0012BA681C|nr:hypothetical protein [Flavobacterium sp. MC2016-06]MBU3859470.1 hypothetical protein [Flavobacterium sp. MC2016-06]
MKKITLICILLCSSLSFAQKVDLDRFYFNVSYQDLPKTIVPLEQRTYATNIITDGPISTRFPSAKVLNNQLNIYGWKKVNENASLTVDLNLADFYEEGTKFETRTVEEKDKDGKVTRSYIMYTLVTTYRGKGYAVVSAPAVAKPVTTAVVEAPAAPAKPANRFLKSTNQEAAPAAAGEASNQLKFNFSDSYSYKSSENVSQSYLEKESAKNRAVNFDLRLREYVDNAIKSANFQLNYNFGFTPISFQEQLWIMDSKEEEGTIQKEAIEAVKLQFAGMKADQPIDKLTQDLQPLIEYFESLKTKYTEDNKGSRKIRYSAYYNLGKIYLYLDQPEKTIKEGEGLIANDYDKGDGKDLISSAKKLIDKFNAAQIRTRHNPSL